MKIRKIIASSLVALFVAAVIAMVGNMKAQAATVVAPTTPAFNIYTDDNPANGAESDFVRVRKSNGNNETPTQDSPWVDPLNASCNVGEKFDVRDYIHNGAYEGTNDNGNGTSVAHGVKLTMTTPLNVKSKNFTFAGTVTATNAASVSDTAKLNCGSDVELKLVPSSVHIYSEPYGWKSLPDSAVNGTTPIGSPNFGSGDQWGCWEYVVVVVYTVEVKPVSPTPTPTPTPTPRELPKTGAGDMLGIFGATSVAGTAAYEIRRRIAKKLER